MIQILEYIKQNYTLFLFGLVLILLAVIGYYADKTVFNQNKSKEKESKESNEDYKILPTIQEEPNDTEKIEKDILNVENVKENIPNNETKNIEIHDLNPNSQPIQYESTNSGNFNNAEPVLDLSAKNDTMIDVTNETNQPLEEQNILNINYQTKQEVNNANLIEEENVGNSESENLDIFEDEIDLLLPQKELISEDLLGEIEGMEINSLKEKNVFDIPDLDEIKLPKIKNVIEKEKDIWKF